MVSARLQRKTERKQKSHMESSAEGTARSRIAKVGHKKSRLGCQRCKSRRVKCDEKKPACTNCERHGAECVYVDLKPLGIGERLNSEESITRRRSSKQMRRHTTSPENDLFPVIYNEAREIEIPETRQRRLMELRLMQHCLLHINQLTPANICPEWLDIWQKQMPQLALQHENVLCAVFTMAATHIMSIEGHDEAVYRARQNYFVLALREQRNAIDAIKADNIDAVCLTSVLILLASFAMLQERDLSVYTAPMDWLLMGRGVGAVMWKANAVLSDRNSEILTLMMGYIAQLNDQTTTYTALASPLSDVLDFQEGSPWDEGIHQTYHRALVYISSVQELINAGQPQRVIERRIQGFPIIVSDRFIELVKEQQPRALVILAYYFGVVAQIDTAVWWSTVSADEHISRRIAVREIRAIEATLPDVWQPLMRWPLSMIAGR